MAILSLVDLLSEKSVDILDAWHPKKKIPEEWIDPNKDTYMAFIDARPKPKA